MGEVIDKGYFPPFARSEHVEPTQRETVEDVLTRSLLRQSIRANVELYMRLYGAKETTEFLGHELPFIKEVIGNGTF